MTTDEFREHGMALINQLLAQGFARPIAFAAIASDGLTTAGSSETITGTVPSGEKTTAPPGAFARYLLPIHLLFMEVDDRDPAIGAAPIAEIIRPDGDRAQADLDVQGEPTGECFHGTPVRGPKIHPGMQAIRRTVRQIKCQPIFDAGEHLAVKELLA
jgi:hypothetical protein